MIIRKLEQKDIAELSVLARKTYSETFGTDMGKLELDDILNDTKSEEAFKKFLSQGDEFLVAEDKKKIVGYIGLQTPQFKVKGREPTRNDQALKGIYVDKNYHRQGIGHKLMDAAFKQSRFLKADNIYLCVWEENKPAYHFYLNYGFKPVGSCDVIAKGKVIGRDLVMMKVVEW